MTSGGKIAVILIVLAVGVGWFVARRPSADRPLNVLLICVDTMRHDRAGYAGYEQLTTPALDRLASQGIVFSNAYSQTGWTLPSMATILTGTYPKTHGATDFHLSMDPSVPTLAATLRDRGYDTRAFTSQLLLTHKYGFAAGFRKFDDSVLDMGPTHDTSTGERISDLAIEDLDNLTEPFFMWVHYFDPHYKYLSHAPWDEFGDSDSDRYDQEIAFADRQIGRLLDALDELGLDDRTIVIFTSDHGEEFGEHGGEYHRTTYDEVVRVPLVVRAPFLAPGESDVITDQIDFVPTILSALGMEDAMPGLPGKDFLSADVEPGPVFIETDRPPGWHQRTVVDGGLKLIAIAEADLEAIPFNSRRVLSPTTNVVPGTYLYDLEADPGEQNDLYYDGHPDADRLLALLAGYVAGSSAAPGEVELDDETREQLRALGYIR